MATDMELHNRQARFRSLSALFEAQVEKTPDRIAVSCGVYAITYRELDAKANQVAHYLAQRGIGPEQIVALYMERSVELIIVLLGVLKAGGAYVPLDTRMPDERIAAILDDCTPRVLIGQKTLPANLAARIPALINLETDWPVIEKHPSHPPAVTVSEDTLLYVIYTSGLTGRPKAVQGIYQGIINRLRWSWAEYPFQDEEIACQRVSISFVDHVAEIFAPLLDGTHLVILPDIQANDPEALILALSRKRISRLVVAPSLLKSILCIRHDPVFHLPHLDYVFCSGETLPTALAGLFYQRFKHARLINIYGAAETSADATWYEVKRSDVDNVLFYFSKSAGIHCGSDTPRTLSTGDDLKGEITAANVPLNTLSKRFRQTQMAEYPTSLTEYFGWFFDEVLPYSIDTASPLYIGHMTSALPDFVHDLSKLVSQMNQNLVKIETAKSAIFLEREALAMLHRCFYGLDDAFYDEYVQKVNTNLGLVTTGGTISNITALMIARNRALSQLHGGEDWSDHSIYSVLSASGYKDLVLLGSELMHYSMKKAASVLGLGVRSIVHVESAPDGALDAADLRRKLEQCQREGLLVFAIVGIAGATETGHIDPLTQMADIAEAHGIYFHVDAAWGGSGMLSAKYRQRFAGMEQAQSITFCAHKQLYLTQGISVCLFRDPRELRHGATMAAYQATPDSYDVGRFSIEGSRSATALLVHAALHLIGRKGYEALFNASVDRALFFAHVIDAMDCFELLFEPPLNIVNYRYIPERYREKMRAGELTAIDNQVINDINRETQETQFLRGATFVSKTTLTNTRYGKECPIVVFRVVLANPLTTQADIHQVLGDQLAIAKGICNDTGAISLQDLAGAPGPSPSDDFFENVVLRDDLGEAIVPVGKPLPNCRVYILDDDLRPVTAGEIGEIHVGGVAVARGYFHRSEDTRKRFLPDPFSEQPEARMFRTGDRGKWLKDGNIDYRGRNDDLVKIGGCRIELSEVESTLQEIAGIKHCAVTVRSDEHGARFLVAHIELDAMGETRIDPGAIEVAARAKLPDYMTPRQYRVVDKMPLTLGGKIDRKIVDRTRSIASKASLRTDIYGPSRDARKKFNEGKEVVQTYIRPLKRGYV
uniref:Putative pyridoxal-dependent aspartate 1-decarboxylase n=1 Tax=Candidatus Kentrum sp. UNK TaxID=2126344 RepID=A0A451AP43_9GAMM|nr:MAG: putative pyridoxal-dependent aspartate 1-decarboxylase [Candidatus Kentron sp. UNK]VFK73183.1 MAG: putative pyridoxal-dependent aspartate 1-decarboxylase [Candidatus Kentron sp. UNK]